MTLIPWICLPQAVIIVILGNFITQKIVRAESWLRGTLIFSSPTTGMASHPLVWLTLGECHLSEWNLELSLSDFRESPRKGDRRQSPVAPPHHSVPHPLKQVLHCDNQALTSPSGHFTHSDFACLSSPWSWKSLPFPPLVLVSFWPCQTKIQPNFSVPRI